jgi:NAD(P)-dependent dehydrogenase (short-subunit alcohol dehydrogenase family)
MPIPSADLRKSRTVRSPTAPSCPSGGSRGIGLVIGIGAAKQGANVVPLTKTDTPHGSPGTVHATAGRRRQGVAVVGFDCHIDSELLRSAGVADLSKYGGGQQPNPVLFLD